MDKTTTKSLKKEFRVLLNSEDGKVRGSLLAWCILTGLWIALGIIFGWDELGVWIQAGFLLVLLILAIKGRGGKYFIPLIAGLISIGFFCYVPTITGKGLQTNHCFTDWKNCSVYSRIPDDVWENEANRVKRGGVITATYYAITAVYFCCSKRAKRHFAWGKRQAQVYRELSRRDKLENSKYKPADNSEVETDEGDDEAELKELLEESRRLTDKIEKLEQKAKRKGGGQSTSKASRQDAEEYDDEL